MTATTPIAAKLATITPEQAEALLAANTHNRSPRQSFVDQYAADMRAGAWQLNGEAIKVATDGQILDGQHRLMAIVEAGTPVETLIITGLPNEAQETMDQGRSRSFGDVLKLRGEAYYAALASATRILAIYERDGIPILSFGRPSPTVQQMSRTLDRNPHLRESVKLIYSDLRKWLPTAAMVTLHYLFASVSQEDADDFFAKLATGENLDASSPIYVLRERLMREHYEALRLNPRVKVAFIIKAWNAYRRGETIKRLQWNAGGSSPDKFPAIDGLAVAPEPDTAG